ncbi:hypothetical protein FNV43_RR22543 [Rhamnella rubrinervis]|uniref:Uncharacterized protein n=1 Tax=Rhamnella rubrinervis TaxID=2594499 RepID=A0A8K0DWU0_9ROSA|nr:hypothetical protein FNV43_RR22543 [Rhamnella rubrinervis]
MTAGSRTHLLMLLCATVLTITVTTSSANLAYPSIPGVGSGDCSLDDGVVPVRKEVYGNGRIFDITHRYTQDMPKWNSDDGLGLFLWLTDSMKNGSLYNASEMKFSVHSGTHVDAPGHFFDHYFDAGFDVDTLDLEVLNGAALLVDVPRDTNITAEVMKNLNIPKGVRRVLFRTLNTDRRLMWKKKFDTSFVGFMEDGAKWLVENTDIKLVGTDYLSVAAYAEAYPAHHVFLKSREIILVEGLKLDDIQLGTYSLHCLPLSWKHSCSNEELHERQSSGCKFVSMALSALQLLPVLLLMLMAMTIEGKTPPGIAKNPSHARCTNSKYKYCANLDHVCPKFCPEECTVNCLSCKPQCIGSSSHPPPEDSNPPPQTPITPPPSNPTYPPPSTPSYPSKPASPLPTSPSPTPPTTTPAPPEPPSTTPTPPSPPITTPSNPPPTPSPSHKPPTPSYPSPPTTTPPSPTTSPPSFNPPSSPTTSTPSSPPSDQSSGAGVKKARCKNRKYAECYDMDHVCPSSCPGGCEVDCVTCKPVCKCDQPGAVCQDPRFIGGDGITFYFHGKKDHDFCLLSDFNIHINAHFIGRRNQNMKRDFTWVQSIGVLFGNHQLYIGAHKTATWDDSVDRLAIKFDGATISPPKSQGASCQPKNALPSVLVTRIAETNSVVVEIEGSLRVTAKVVPITQEDSRIHNYGITNEDSFAHLDLVFKFFSLSNQVSGVLGQTYRPDYVSRVNIGAKMSVMGGDKEFKTSTLLGTDCAVARFKGIDGSASGEEAPSEALELPSLNCESGLDGQGVVCKK